MKTGAVIVAAGMSSRMKRFKPLMIYENKTMITTIIHTFRDAGVDPIVVVTGNHGEELEKALQEERVICIRNPRYAQSEMLDSARIGMKSLREKCDRFLFTPVDIPGFSLDTVRAILATKGELVKPSCGNKSGHPLMIHTEYIESICKYAGDDGLRGALRATGVATTFVEVNDEGILVDLDTPEEYESVTGHQIEIEKTK